MSACNEEEYVERTLRAVVAQTLKPVAWLIVDDGSDDRTPDIVESYSREYPFIRLHRLTDRHSHDFTARIAAINTAYAELNGEAFEFIGNLDADVSFGPDYFERLLGKFAEQPMLGIAGGCLCEERANGRWEPRSSSPHAVPSAVQTFRRECFEAIGGYRPLKYGAPDTYAEIQARMSGWDTRAFSDLPAYHHRPTGSAAGRLRNAFRHGLVAYSFGSAPAFEVLKSIGRLRMRPAVLGAACRLAGFCTGYLRREPRLVTAEFAQFLRAEQRARMRSYCRRVFR